MKLQLVAGLIAGLQVHQIMLMQSRGCMLAVLLIAAAGVLLMPRSPRNYAIICLGFLAASLLAGPSVVDEFSSSFRSGEQLDSSAASRFDLWKAGLRITADYPMLGVGPNAARRLVPLPQYYDCLLYTSPSPRDQRGSRMPSSA